MLSTTFYAGDPPVRFGGRGDRIQSVLPTPISKPNCTSTDYRNLLLPNPHVRTAAATLARFSACNFAGPLLSASILWNRERLPALNADLCGDEEARGTALGPRRKKSENRPGGLA